MEERSLDQRHLGTRHRLQILEGGVWLATDSFISSHVLEIPFEEITPHPVEYTRGSRAWLILAGGFSAVAAFGVLISGAAGFGMRGVGWAAVFAALGVAMLLGFATTRQNRILLSHGNPGLDFLQDRPSRGEVETFVAQIREAQQQYLRSNYGVGGAITSNVELIERLAYLLEHEAITAEEYETLKAEIIARARWSAPREDIDTNGSYL